MRFSARCRRLVLVLALLGLAHSPLWAQDTAWKGLQGEEQVEWLLQRLSLDEKLSLMVHQNPAVERLGLPAYSWWNEALHGVGRAGEARVYPMPIGLAASFNPALVREVFAEVALEARLKYAQAQDTANFGDYAGLSFFTPNINIFRDPRWGRGMETYGEDPYLTALMGRACVEGLQHGRGQASASAPLYTAACLKHLAVHSGPEGVRHEFDSRISDRDLRTTYLAAFEYIIVHTDVQQVMCAYNRLNGVPCCTNRQLFDILRNEWGYDGILVTDCWALNDAYETDTVIPRHRTHATAAEAYADAFGREVDLECGSGLPALRQAVEQGLLGEEQVDRHVRRLLRTRLALCHTPTQSVRVDLAAASSHSDMVVQEASERSVVMLKNSGVLPLAPQSRIYLCGPNAADTLMPLGNYNGTPRHTVSIAEGLGERFTLVSSPDSADLVVYAGGLSPQLEGEELPIDTPGFYRGDRTRIELPDSQQADLRRLRASGRPLLLLLCTGSAIALEGIEAEADAILVAWYGGEAMGSAVASQIADDNRPHRFGRLPVSFYGSTAQLPPFDDYAMRQRTYRYMSSQPLYPFGFGLGYVEHHVAEAQFEADSLRLRLSVEATRALGRCSEGEAVVQVYLSNPSDTLAPLRQLVGIVQVPLRVGERSEATLRLDPFWLRCCNPQSGRMESPTAGTCFELLVGLSSADPSALRISFRYPAQ